MTVSRKMLRYVYGLIAVLALIGTWGNNFAYLGRGFVDANLQFWGDTFANPASRSITVDLFFLGLAVFVWMVLEARRLRMRFVWLYLVFGILIAISVTVPIFLINRERALSSREASTDPGVLTKMDSVGLCVVTFAMVGYTVATLIQAAP